MASTVPRYWEAVKPLGVAPPWAEEWNDVRGRRQRALVDDISRIRLLNQSRYAAEALAGR
jgi:hypothetical protein